VHGLEGGQTQTFKEEITRNWQKEEEKVRSAKKGGWDAQRGREVLLFDTVSSQLQTL
jgi:hypothetical protein